MTKKVTKDALVAAYTELSGLSKSSSFTFQPPSSTTSSTGAPAFSFSAPPAGAATAEPPSFQFNFSGSVGAPASGGGGDDDDDGPQAGGREIVRALQRRADALSMSSQERRDDTVGSLPAPVRARVEKLEKLQETTDALQKEFNQASLSHKCLDSFPILPRSLPF